jgi:hypothetical protein
MSLRLIIMTHGPAQSGPVLGPNAQVLAKTIAANSVHSSTANSVFYANGVWEGIAGGDVIIEDPPFNWLLGGNNTDFDILAKKTGGTTVPTFSTGWANNAWMPLNANRFFRLQQLTTGNLTCTASVSIRFNSNLTVVSTATHTMSAEALK